MGTLVEELEPLEYPRRGNAGRHSLHDILVIALCTILCGGETCTDMALFGQSKREFLESFLPLQNGIPSHDTFSRVFRLLDPEAFQKWFLGFMRQFAQGCEGVLAVDGKPVLSGAEGTLRRSYDRAEAKSPPHPVSAWAAEQRLVLGQLAVDGKSNEITAVPKLLEMLALPGMVVTADAMHSQRQLSRQIPEQGADYVPALKGNQESLNDDVRLFPDDPATPKVQATTVNKGHGRIETRTAGISDDVAWLRERRQGPGLAAVGEDNRQPAAGRPHQRREPVLPADPSIHAGAVQPHRPGTLGHREPAALGPGCGVQRGPVPKPEGSLSRQSGLATEAGTEPGPAGILQRLHQRQAETGRMGQSLPGHYPVSVHHNPNAIALFRSPLLLA